MNAGNYASSNSNGSLPASCYNGTDFGAILACNIPAGTYYVRNLTLAANVVLTVNGPTTFYVTGDTTILGSILVQSNDPANFKIRVIGSGPVNLAANTAIYCDLYAPQSPVQITVGLSYYGAIVGQTLDVLGTSFLHSTSLASTEPGAGVSLVR